MKVSVFFPVALNYTPKFHPDIYIFLLIFLMLTIPKCFIYIYIYIQVTLYQSNRTNFIIIEFFGQHVSTPIESSSGPSKLDPR